MADNDHFVLQTEVLERLTKAARQLNEARKLVREYAAKKELPNYRFSDIIVPIGVAIASIGAATEEIVGQGIALETSELSAFEQEDAAFRRIHPQLIASSLGKFVAIYGGQMIDQDMDVAALTQRIEQRLPHDFVLVRRVELTIEEQFLVLRTRLPPLN